MHTWIFLAGWRLKKGRGYLVEWVLCLPQQLHIRKSCQGDGQEPHKVSREWEQPSASSLHATTVSALHRAFSSILACEQSFKYVSVVLAENQACQTIFGWGLCSQDQAWSASQKLQASKDANSDGWSMLADQNLTVFPQWLSFEGIQDRQFDLQGRTDVLWKILQQEMNLYLSLAFTFDKN